MAAPSFPPAVAHLRTLGSIRERCARVFEVVSSGGSDHWTLDDSKMSEVVSFVQQVTSDNYPDGVDTVPFHSRWRHFEPGNVDRAGALEATWTAAGVDADEICRRKLDLVLTSVLLDAGAGPTWSFTEADGTTFARSEGLGVASFRMFESGAFSSLADQPHQADAAALAAVTPDTVATAFQVSDENPLVGCEGRAGLLRRLGEVLQDKAYYFGVEGSDVRRPGHLLDFVRARADESGSVSIHVLWDAVINGLENMWPPRFELEGHQMGDVWPYAKLGADTEEGNLVSFHKLSQWLTYSLIEPLQAAGLTITEQTAQTGLPEYRNGGLLVDLGVMVPKHDGVCADPHAPDSEVIVEWRACTVILMDRIAELFREAVGATPEQLPLVKILQGGTWTAGRVAARNARPETGGPPLNIVSDGTVF